jgi:phosphoglycolate phosphatase-like HAD superfamily hydrolase
MRIQVSEHQTLIFDGDDTLWENNVYFERAIDDFIAYLDHSTLSPAGLVNWPTSPHATSLPC